MSSDHLHDIAIIGTSCRFPGHSNSLTDFWSNLTNSVDCVTSTPSDRWNSEFYTNPAKEVPGRITTDRCGFIDHVYDFDYEAFGISKREAENMDPQQKVLLECTMQALEDARVEWAATNMGVYVGIGQAEQLELTTSDLESINAYSVTGSALSIAANRISYVFDLRGPSVSVDTACSSGMTALHFGVQAIRRGECESAVIAGVNLLMSPSVMIQFSKLGVMSPDGRCKSFTDIADGYVRSEGCGVVIVKPLAAAIRDHNHIYAVIKGTAINQDGHRSPSLTLPSGDQQAIAFENACRDGKINPKQIFFAEAHATGTKVGDPVEANAIGRVFGEGRKKSSTPITDASEDLSILRIGGVKTHVGHLECASYMAGLLKVVCMLKYETLVPNLYCGDGYKLNPAIEFEKYNLRVQSKHEKFNPHGKLFMVSSFGFGGANGCSIIEGYKPHVSIPRSLPDGHADGLVNGTKGMNGINGNGNGTHQEEESAAPLEGPYLFLLSAATPAALDARIKQIQSSDLSAYSQADISYTLATRSLHRNVSVGVGNDVKSVVFAPPKKVADEATPIIWVFAGQGPQHPDMGRTLYQRYPAFRESINEMDAVYKQVSGESLVHDVGLFGSKRGDDKAVYTLQYTLPSLVFLQTALCDLWASFGIQPVAVFGHSFGEMAAAYAARVCNKKQLITTAYHRARLLAKIDGLGVMMAVGCSSDVMQPWLDEEKDVWIAAYNGPNSITVGGVPAAVERIAKRCTAANLFNRVLKITNAYHTPLMSPCHDEAIATFRETLAGTSSPQIPYFSTVTKSWKTDGFDEHYTWAGIVGPVYFTDAVRSAMERYGDNALFMEMSAHPVLSSYLTECGAKFSCMTLHRQQHEQESTLKTLATLKINGHKIDFDTLLRPSHPLPFFATYPFQHQACHREDSNHRVMREVPSWRVLAGREISAIHTTFQQKISLKGHPWVADHVVQGPIVFPAAGYIEMCMEVLNSNSVGNISIGRAMIINTDGNIYRTVRTVADDDTRNSVKIFSKVDQWDNGPWVQHVSAQKTPVSEFKELPAWCNGLQSRCTGEMNQKSIYERFKSVGLTYGPLFQGVTSLKVGDNEAFGTMSLKAIHDHSKAFYVHPALLDSTFHVLLGTIRYMYLPYVPTLIRRIQWFAKAEEMDETVHVYARSVYSDNSLEGDIIIADTNGKVLGSVEGMQCTALGQTADKRPMQPTYTVGWQPYAVPGAFAPTRPAVWSEIPADALTATKTLDDAMVAYAAAFIAGVKASPKPLPIAKLPAPKQQLYATLEAISAGKQPSSSATTAIDSLTSFELEAQVVHRIGKGLQDLLTDPFGVGKVFNDTLITDLYAKSSTFRVYNKVIADQVVLYLDSHPTRVVHILEVGAGSLALANEIIPILASKNYIGRIKYVLTDNNAKLLSELKTKFSVNSFVDFKLINLDDDLIKQGLLPHTYDFVLANDVLHTASVPLDVVNRISSVLVPNGILLASEATSVPIWLEVFYTLFKTSTFPAAEAWRATLVAAGFHSVSIQQSGEPEFVHSIIAAQSPALVANANVGASSNANSVIFDAHEKSLDSLLELAQSTYESKDPIDYWVVTSNGETVPESFTASSSEPLHAQFVGFTRTWANECPQHAIHIVDFAEGTNAATRASWIHTLQSFVTSEREVAIRNDTLLVPRGHLYSTTVAAPLSVTPTAQSAPFRLEVGSIGQVSSLQYRSVASSNGVMLDYGVDDVVISVRASALNFKDLMLALGMLNNPMGLDSQSLKFHPPTSMGLECAGVIVAVGSKVNRFKVGDEVFAICEHSVASQVVTHQNFVATKPAHMSFVEAASLPIVFCTSYSGLIDKARIQAGETVLVHSAAGGIGQSSIQLCKHVKANVIATVGNVKKRQYLTEKYGVTMFADSHSNAAWKKDVMDLTHNIGVDAVINSLKGEAIQYGLECLKVGGRFVEIGKVDILANNELPMGVFLKDISFLSTQLDILMTGNSARVSKYLTAIAELAQIKAISPLVDKVYSAKDIEPAFRYLMAGQHMGKVMVDFSAENLPTAIYPSSHVFVNSVTYMLSGGCGAVGLRVVQWMAEQGARYFILLSRRGESALRASELKELRSLERFGVHIHIAKADVGSKADVKRSYDEARALGHPANVGIMHLAMVLEDDPLPKQSSKRFAPVLACKVDGIRNMVNAFPKENVAFVIMFSSVSSVLGNPAQSNYAAGNAFLDAYAFYLNAKGYKAKTVNLGSIEDVGVLAEDYKLRMVLNMKGFAGGLTSAGVCKIIDAMLRDDQHTQFVHGAVEWGMVTESYAIMQSRFNHLVDYTAANNAGGGSSDNAVTVDALKGAIAGLLEMNVDKLDAKEPITRQGLDSLLAVELSSTLKKKFGVTVSQMELLGGMSVEDIFKHAQAQA